MKSAAAKPKKDFMASWFCNCERCGKRFSKAPQHLYKIDSKYYCSYTCWTRAKEERKAKRYSK